jgi:tetratricopeptide (TPR) repeat protein
MLVSRRRSPSSIERVADGEIRTTAGPVAIGNLQARITGQEREAAAGWLSVQAHAGLIELIALRGNLLGRIADHEWADTLAERLAEVAPPDGDALLARGRTRATGRRFAEAMTDLDDAERLGADPDAVDAERATVFRATGRYEEALEIYRAAVERRANFQSLGDLATIYADRGDLDAAERTFAASRSRYRGTSPIPLAELDVERARMWSAQGDLPVARLWLDEAVRRLPAHAPAAGHLAEVEAAMGDTDTAIARLLPLTESSDDPAYPARLALVLGGAGHPAEAGRWWARAAAGYDDLTARHVEGYAHHAARLLGHAP